METVILNDLAEQHELLVQELVKLNKNPEINEARITELWQKLISLRGKIRDSFGDAIKKLRDPINTVGGEEHQNYLGNLAASLGRLN